MITYPNLSAMSFNYALCGLRRMYGLENWIYQEMLEVSCQSVHGKREGDPSAWNLTYRY